MGRRELTIRIRLLDNKASKQSHLFFSSGEGGEENPGSADQAIDEATTALEGGLDEEEEEDDDVVDLRAFSAIGPLMFIELLDLPPQPKVVNGWIMQQSKHFLIGCNKNFALTSCLWPHKDKSSILISSRGFHSNPNTGPPHTNNCHILFDPKK